jgi:hypothetical protein
MKLIDNIGRAWRLLSVQVAGVAIAWGLMPAAQQAAVLGLVGLGPEQSPAVLGVLFLLARLIKQPGAMDSKAK